MFVFDFDFPSAFGGFVWGVFFSYVWGLLATLTNLIVEKTLLYRQQRKELNDQ